MAAHQQAWNPAYTPATLPLKGVVVPPLPSPAATSPVTPGLHFTYGYRDRLDVSGASLGSPAECAQQQYQGFCWSPGPMSAASYTQRPHHQAASMYSAHAWPATAMYSPQAGHTPQHSSTGAVGSRGSCVYVTGMYNNTAVPYSRATQHTGYQMYPDQHSQKQARPMGQAGSYIPILPKKPQHTTTNHYIQERHDQQHHAASTPLATDPKLKQRFCYNDELPISPISSTNLSADLAAFDLLESIAAASGEASFSTPSAHNMGQHMTSMDTPSGYDYAMSNWRAQSAQALDVSGVEAHKAQGSMLSLLQSGNHESMVQNMSTERSATTEQAANQAATPGCEASPISDNIIELAMSSAQIPTYQPTEEMTTWSAPTASNTSVQPIPPASAQSTVHPSVDTQCDRCHKDFSTRAAKTRHMKTCTAEQYCPICDRTFKTSGSYKQHKRLAHQKVNECALCAITLPTPAALKQHMLSHKAASKSVNPCWKCDAEFSTRYQLNKHRKICLKQ